MQTSQLYIDSSSHRCHPIPYFSEQEDDVMCFFLVVLLLDRVLAIRG